MAAPDTEVLYRQLLRPPLLDILRAAGFTRTQPAVLETLLDLTSRYMTLLASHTATHAYHRQPFRDTIPQPSPDLDEAVTPPMVTITDIRMALQDVGALYPQTSELECFHKDGNRKEDTRGVDNFIEWCRGDINAEIRRVAGMTSVNELTLANSAAPTTAAAKANSAPGSQPPPAPSRALDQRRGLNLNTLDVTSNSMTNVAAAAVAAGETEAALLNDMQSSLFPEDYLAALKKKHSKTGEESRWQGTVLGREAPPVEDDGGKTVVIEGWDVVGSLQRWGEWVRESKSGGQGNGHAVGDDGEGAAGNLDEERARASESSSPLSDIDGSGSGGDDGFG